MRLWLFLLLVVGLAFGTTIAQAESGRLRVVATTPLLGSIVSQVGGPDVDVVTLTSATEDPHFAQPKREWVRELARADLVVRMGRGLEDGWLLAMIVSSENPKIQPDEAVFERVAAWQLPTPSPIMLPSEAPSASPGTSPLPEPSVVLPSASPEPEPSPEPTYFGYFDASDSLKEVEAEKPTQSMRQVHPRGSPHYLLDPRNAISVFSSLADRLSLLRPEKADSFKGRAAAATEELRKKIVRWQDQLQGRNQVLLTYHPSWSFLVNWLDWKEWGSLESLPGVPPTPESVSELMKKPKPHRSAHCLLLLEPYHPRSTAEWVARKLRCRVAVIPSEPSGKLPYAESMDRLMKGLSTLALGKRDQR